MCWNCFFQLIHQAHMPVCVPRIEWQLAFPVPCFHVRVCLDEHAGNALIALFAGELQGECQMSR